MQSVSFYACALNSEVQRLNIFQLYFIPCVMKISSVKCQFMKGNVIYMCVSDYIVSVKWYRHWSDNANEDGRQRWVGEKKIEISLCMIRCDIASVHEYWIRIISILFQGSMLPSKSVPATKAEVAAAAALIALWTKTIDFVDNLVERRQTITFNSRN